MNNTQKYFVIIGVMSFLWWFLVPFRESTNFLRMMELFFIDLKFSPFSNRSPWFEHGVQYFSFVLMIGSGLGYYLFKDAQSIQYPEPVPKPPNPIFK